MPKVIAQPDSHAGKYTYFINLVLEINTAHPPSINNTQNIVISLFIGVTEII